MATRAYRVFVASADLFTDVDIIRAFASTTFRVQLSGDPVYTEFIFDAPPDPCTAPCLTLVSAHTLVTVRTIVNHWADQVRQHVHQPFSVTVV